MIARSLKFAEVISIAHRQEENFLFLGITFRNALLKTRENLTTVLLSSRFNSWSQKLLVF